ncbi:alpha/beta-hydrolase [Bimuria novae-zelandiae CBS 107.79]|uniref:Alpha/beta-hydrolase n=1 Tax=Bimuria novae-zelandiae CBS 107.79 TaxID=1447943 RepID=A0A6A5VBT9_9PLEO|nr:alpha/beta-hydrolase [Bimuria novae-zelandiae CBS 107.79]
MPFFKNGPVSLFFTTHGSPSHPSILLLHGWACDAHDWSHQIPLLNSLSLHVIALDLRGHGRSSAPPSVSEYSMRALADDVVALLQHLQTGPAIVMAHSMGTIVASILAVQNPDLVRALVVAHPIYSGTPDALVAMSRVMCEDPIVAPETCAEFFKSVMYTAQTPEWLKTWHIRRVLGTDGVALAGCSRAIVELFGKVVGQSEEAKAFMRKRRAPRLVVATNALPAAAAWEEELGLGPEDRCCSLDEGTFSHFVDSERFNAVLRDWLVRRGFVAQNAGEGSLPQ